MKPIPGTLQEGGASFRTTHWTLILCVQKNQSQELSEQAISEFCEGYWPPLYAFLRRRGYSSPDAQDYVQGFFTYVLAQGTLTRADREKGKLRTYLLTGLRNFVMDEHDRARTIKRGGGLQILSFDEFMPEAEASMLATSQLDDTSTYDLTWASNIARRAWQRLREAMAAEGKEKWLDQLKPFIAAGADAPNQEEVAAKLGVPIATLRTWLSRLRQRYRTLLRMEVASTVSNPADVDEELHYLHRVLMTGTTTH